MYKILMTCFDSKACGYYRAIMPYLHCKDELEKHGISLKLASSIDLNEHFDCYIFHRLVAPKFLPILWDMKFNGGKKIVWDLDDNLFKVPSWSPAREMSSPEQIRYLMTTLEWADHITVTTEEFKECLSKDEVWSPKISVVPNLITEKDWNFPFRHGTTGQTRILWAGSLTHKNDIDLIADTCMEAIKEFKNRVQFLFMGMIPDALRIRLGLDKETVKLLRDGAIEIGACELRHYPQILNILAPTIALAPIEENEFNYCKSNIKYLEMSMAGAPVIASNFGPYKSTIEHGVDGFLFKDQNDFKSILFDIIDSDQNLETWCSRINQNAVNRIKNKYTWESESKNRWIDFFKKLAE